MRLLQELEIEAALIEQEQKTKTLKAESPKLDEPQVTPERIVEEEQQLLLNDKEEDEEDGNHNHGLMP